MGSNTTHSFRRGQSGFIALDPTTNLPVFGPHVRDQIELLRDFRYKPMQLFRNAQLRE